MIKQVLCVLFLLAVSVPAFSETVYTSPMRQQCESELKKDTEWYAGLKAQLRDDVHEEEAKLIATNKKHVFMAYGALWVIVVGFVALMWKQGRGLRGRIAELEGQLAQHESD